MHLYSLCQIGQNETHIKVIKIDLNKNTFAMSTLTFEL